MTFLVPGPGLSRIAAALRAAVVVAAATSCSHHDSPPPDADVPLPVELSQLIAMPSSVNFTHASDSVSLTVTGMFTNSIPQDLTNDPMLGIDFKPPGVAALTTTGSIVPLADGSATLTISYGAVQTTVPIISAICKPQAPALDATIAFAFNGSVHVSGQAPGADRVRLAMPHSSAELPVTAGQFAGDVPVTAGADDLSETWSAIAVRDACVETSAAAFLHVHQDRRAPTLAVVEPRPHTQVSSPTIDVIGSVQDSGSAADSLSVKVNGTPARLRAGLGTQTTFVARGVALTAGLNTLTVSAMDAAGNTTTQTVEVFFAPPTGPSLAIAAGSAQEAAVLTVLPAPLTVRVADANGQPLAGKLVTFSVAHSDGLLGGDSAAPTARLVQSRTGADGIASARWKLGSAAGLGNNLVEARATGVAGVTRFWASALAGPPVAVGVVDSMPHVAEAGATVDEHPRVWVNDGCNGIAGASVLFSVASGRGRVSASQGNGQFDGKTQVTIVTDISGYAEVDFALGPEAGKQTITATLVDHPEVAPATLEALAVTRRSDATTGFSGRVVSDSDEAIGGATLTLAAGGQQATTTSAADGSFTLSNFAGAGVGILTIDGSTATSDAGHAIPTGTYPTLTYDVNVVAHADNALGRPIFLPELRTGNSASYSLTQPTVLTMAGMPGMQLTIAPGSMTLTSGTVAPAGTKVSLNPVDPNRIPMPLPSGAGNPIAWTLQPSGARFNPPVQIQVPNTSGLAPGTEVSFFTFDHDLSRFEMVARGAVSEDGGTVVSDTGTGITKAGWGGLCPPYFLRALLEACPGLKSRAFWDNAIKFGIQLTGLLVGIPEADKCIAMVDQSLADYDKAENSCKAAVAGAQGLLGVISSCTPFLPEPNKVLETVAGISDAIGTANDLVKSSGCIKDSPTEALANKTVDLGTSIVKTGAELANNIKQGNLLYGSASAEVAIIDKVVCDDENADAIRAKIQQLTQAARGKLTQFESTFSALASQLQSFNDTVSPWAADAATVFEALKQPALAGCEVSAGGQSALVDEFGGFELANIIVPDNFGANGPGSPRDFLSDDLLRVVGTCVINGVRQWIYSEFVQPAANKPTFVSDFTFSPTPPAEPDTVSLALAINPPPTAMMSPGPAPAVDAPDAASLVFTAAGQTGQITTTAALTDGSKADITPLTAGTTYRTSNLAIGRVSPDGLVTAVGSGTAFITASNGGASSVIPIVVALGDPLTRVEGRVVNASGTTAAGATVTTSTITGTSADNGSFVLDGVPTVLGDIIVAGRLGAVSGSSLPVSPRPGLITDVGDVVLGRHDSLGTEFLVLFEQNVAGTALTLFLSGPVATTGVAEVSSLGFSMPFSIVPGKVTSLTVPAGAANATSDTVGQLAVHVTAEQEIAVYGLNAAPFSTDAFVAMPVDVLGTRYRVMAWPGSSGGPSQFEIAAISAGTAVTITPTTTVGTRTAGAPYTITLNALDTYQLAASTGDLTGTLIEASAPVAVFAGHRCANVPLPTTSACDHLTEQMPPVSQWSSELLSEPLATRKGGDLFRIVADTDNTQVTIDGPTPSTATLAAGQILQVALTGASRISATAPILVAQFANSQAFDNVTGDPMMMVLVPVTEFARGYTFTTPTTGFTTNFVNLVVPVDDVNLDAVMLDGKPVNPASFTPLPHSAYAAAQVSLTAGGHVVSAPDPIGLYVYGFANFNAYGYAGGFSVAP